MPDEQYSFKRRIKLIKLRRKARRGQILFRRTFKFIRFCIVISMFFAIYKLAHLPYWYLSSDTFTTGKNIEIYGNSIVSNTKILNELKKNPFPNRPIYKINPNKITLELEKLPPIKRAYVRRFWFPARLVIIVEEVIPSIIISPSENTQEIAAYSFDGIFISRDYLPLTTKEHAVKVLSYGTNDDDYEKWDVKKINDLYRLVKLIEHYSGEKVQYLDLRIPNNAFVQLESVKIRLGVLDLNAYERIKVLSSMMKSEDVKHLAANTKYIDLSWSNVSYINVLGEE